MNLPNTISLTSLEKQFSDSVGCLVKVGDKIGINLGLNFILEKNKYDENIKLEIPEVKGVRVYFPDIFKSYYQDINTVKVLDSPTDIVGTKECISRFLLYFFMLDEIGIELNLDIQKIDSIVKRYFNSGLSSGGEFYVKA